MDRGDTVHNERTFSDRDDEGEELGGFTGGIPYDEDEDEDGGWAINKDHSDSLWDSAEEADDDEEAETTELVDAGEGDEEETDVFGGSLSAPRRRGRRPTEKPALGAVAMAPAVAAVAKVATGGAKGKSTAPKPAPKPASKPVRPAGTAKASAGAGSAHKKDKSAPMAKRGRPKSAGVKKPSKVKTVAKMRVAKKPAAKVKKATKRAKPKKR